MKKVKQFTPLKEHCKEDHQCQGACPLCGGCIWGCYGLAGGTIGVYHFCVDNDECSFGEIIADPELYPEKKPEGSGS